MKSLKGKYFGELPSLGPEDLIDVEPNLTLALTHKLQFFFSTVFYWRYNANDAICGLGGNIVRPAVGSKASFIGAEWEPAVSYQVSRTL